MSTAVAEAPVGAEKDAEGETESFGEGWSSSDWAQEAERQDAKGNLQEALAARRKMQELEGEAGAAVGDMPAAAPREDVLPPDEIVIGGDAQLSFFKLGGKAPTSASMKLTGGKVKIADGQAFKKGTRIVFSGEAVVNDVGGKDAHDPATQQVTSCELRHGARITDLRVTPAGQKAPAVAVEWMVQGAAGGVS